MTTIKTYTIANSNGITGGAWSDEFSSLEEATAALQSALGWDELVLSPSFCVSEQAEGWEAYQSQADCDAKPDGDGYAPRIIETSAQP